jgi:endonuclease/exonuclease/phosphatase family metal-dependent hydrolase
MWSFKHFPFHRPSEGLAICSRAPLVRMKAFAISRGEPWWSWRRRIVQAVVVEQDGALVRVANTHLGAGVTDEERARQARRIVSIAANLDLLAGDLNVLPDSGVLAELVGLRDSWATLHPHVRSPNTNWEPGPRDTPPVQRLDYVMAAPSWRVLDVSIPTDWERWAPLSDHLPVVVDLERVPPDA